MIAGNLPDSVRTLGHTEGSTDDAVKGEVFVSTKSTPGDGQHGKGSKGVVGGEPRRGAVAFVKDLARGVLALRRR